jgi:hypothetical protein
VTKEERQKGKQEEWKHVLLSNNVVCVCKTTRKI